MEGNTEKELQEPFVQKDNLVETLKSIFNADNRKKIIATGDSTTLSEKVWTEKFREADICKQLKVNPNKGLDMNDTSDIAERKRIHGDNISQEVVDEPFMSFVLECFKDETLRILCIASAVSLLIGIYQEGLAKGWLEGVAIFMAVFVVVAITAFNNWKKSCEFNKLHREGQKKTVFVKREGKKIGIDSEMLLAGDILFLTYGNELTVDGILLDNELFMDESANTGESEALKKTPKILEGPKGKTNPFLISGTKAVKGSGLVIVCTVGKNTVASIINENLKMKEADGDANKTALEKQLGDLADEIGQLGKFMAILIGSIMIAKEILIRWATGEAIFTMTLVDTFINSFIIGVIVLVVAIPEGLPMAVTISLAFSVFKMKDEHCLVKHLSASETMGNCNNICTDKTGTLTEGVMSVTDVFVMEQNYALKEESTKLPENVKVLMGELISTNINSIAEKIDGKFSASGENFTDNALLNFLLDQNITYELGFDKAFAKLTFDSAYKMMFAVQKKGDNNLRLYIKGAPERIFDRATHFYAKGGQFKPLTPKDHDNFKKQQNALASACKRTFVIGYRDFTLKEFEEIASRSNGQDFEFFSKIAIEVQIVCLLGIADNYRSDVPQAIKSCHSAGVTVRMVTGDNIRTAISIAKDVSIIDEKQAGEAMAYVNMQERLKEGKRDQKFSDFALLSESPVALEGADFKELAGGYSFVDKPTEGQPDKLERIYSLNNLEKFKIVTKNLKVIARASPDDKLLLVLGLKLSNPDNIVAVTGDGTNDAQAMKVAHVGFAMGLRGTDIAKGQADIVLLKDTFSSVVTAIKYGRNVYDCVKKFLQFQLTTNVVAVFMTLIGGVVLKDAPLNAIQMLWVNLIMDSFASIALATEDPHDDLLKRRPYKKSAKITTKMMTINIVTQSVFQIVTLSFILFYGDALFGVPSDRELNHFTWNDTNGYHFTIFFNIFVFMQIFNSINARKLIKTELNIFEGIFDNYLYILIQGITFVGQIFLVTFGGRAVRTHPLSLNQHLACALIASFTLVVGLIVKLIPFDVEESNEKEVAKTTGALSLGGKSRGTRRYTTRTSLKISRQ